MKLTEEQKEIALRVAAERGIYLNAHDDMIVKFAARFLAALPKPEPVAFIGSGWTICFAGAGPIAPIVRKHNLKIGDALYAEAPIATPASEQKPIAWVTTNEDGDYAMLFFDQQEARSYSGDDEPIGLAPVSSSAPQPDYKEQRDAERLNADTLREPINGDEWRVEWWNESCRMMLPAGMILDCFQAYKNGTLQFTIKKRAAIASVKGGA